MKITCDVIRDLAELYVGNALSEDSKAIVEEHIAHCGKCKDYIELSRESFESAPIIDCRETAHQKADLKEVKYKFLRQLLSVIVMTVVVVAITFALAAYILFEYEVAIPYDGENVYVTEEGLLYFPKNDNVSVSFFKDDSMRSVRIEVSTNYFNKIKGTDTGGEYGVLDLKEVSSEILDYKVYYKDNNGEQVIWESRYDIIKQ